MRHPTSSLATRLPTLAFCLLGLSATAEPHPPVDPSSIAGQERTGALNCGSARFEATTRFLDVPDQSRQVSSQTLQSLGQGLTAPHRLPHEGRPLKQPFLKQTPVLDAWVSGWACLASADGQHLYLYLLYTCTESPSRPACAGTEREWPRLLDLSGRPLNAGFAHAGPRTGRLMLKLGLGRYLQEGVSLKDITDQGP